MNDFVDFVARFRQHRDAKPTSIERLKGRISVLKHLPEIGVELKWEEKREIADYEGKAYVAIS